MLKKFLHLFTIWSLFFTQATFALDIKLQRELTIRQKGSAGLEVIAKLPKGTILAIPDQYVGTQLKGKKRDEVALLNWLKSGGTLKQFVAADGSIKRDFYFPVKVVSTPDSSVNEGLEGEVALQYLAKKDGLELLAVSDTDLLPSSKDQASASEQDCAECRMKETKTPVSDTNIFKELTSKLEGIFSRIDTEVEKKVSAKSYPTVFIENFNATCGMSFDKFLPILKEESISKGIPPEIMLAIMSAESEGRCDAMNQDKDGTYSVGLFQINTKSTTKSLSQLNSPVENMRESIRILVEKYRLINGGFAPSSKTTVSLMNEKEKTAWRKALSAYNGGEGHVFQSKKDLQSFSAKYGIKLDDEDWNNRKAFYFRKHLETNSSIRFDNQYKYKRSTDNAVANIVYVESILDGRDGVGSIVDSWYPELIKISTVPETKSYEDEKKRQEEERQKRIDDERKREEEERRRIEEERKRAEEEKRLAEEQQKLREEEQKRLEEEKRLAEIERRKQEEERKRLEDEKRRLEEEKRKREEEARKLAEAERKRLEEERRLAQIELEKAKEEERKRKEEEDRVAAAEKAMNDFVLEQEEKNKQREREYQQRREIFEAEQQEAFVEYQRKLEEDAERQAELDRLEKVRLENEEINRLNTSKHDYLPASLQNVYRTTILGIARLKYQYRFRNESTKYFQKCTVFIKSFYNQVDDVDEHTFVVPPGGSKEITGTLSKPWVGQGARVEKDCEFLPPDYKEPARHPAFGGPRHNR